MGTLRRTGQRHRAVRPVVAFVIAFLVALGPAIAGAPWNEASATQNGAAPGSLLTNTALDGYSELGQIDMLSPSFGYALADHPLKGGHFAYYLVRTTTLGKSWTIVGRRLFEDGYYPNLDDEGGFDSNPPIDFVTRDVGYVAGPRGIIYMTSDAGRSWSRIASSSGYGVTSSTLSLVNTRCKPPGSASYSCVNTLIEYPVGSAVPERSSTVPGTPSESVRTALLAVAPGPVQVVDLANDGDSTPTSLLITRDAGATWSTMTNPCAGQMIEQLAVAADGEWLLSCFHDEGMSQGPAKVFRSANDGSTWTTVLNEVHGTSIYYFFSGNGHVLFGAATNPAGGLAYSTDGGLKWTRLPILGNSGGASESVVNFGPMASIYQVNQGPLYVTRNDRTWTILPPLSAGTHDHLSICTKRDVKVQFHRYKSGGLHYEYLDFVNVAAVACYLDGVPIIRPVNSSGQKVGPWITTNGYSSSGDFVVLKAHGGEANVDFQINPPSAYTRSAHCHAKRVSAVRIEFATTSQLRLSLGATPISVCTTFASVSTNQVRPGPGHVPHY